MRHPALSSRGRGPSLAAGVSGTSSPARLLLASGRQPLNRPSSRLLRCRVHAVAQVSRQEAATKKEVSPAGGSPSPAPEEPPSPDSSALAPSSIDDVAGIMAAKINAVASKINAARELARRLAEEKQAENKGGEVVRTAQEATAAAAAQAARADALARALRKAETTRDQLQRLKAENEALRDLLLELAADKEAAKARLAQVADAAAVLVARATAAAALHSAGSPAAPSPAASSPALSSIDVLALPSPSPAALGSPSPTAATATAVVQPRAVVPEASTPALAPAPAPPTAPPAPAAAPSAPSITPAQEAPPLTPMELAAAADATAVVVPEVPVAELLTQVEPIVGESPAVLEPQTEPPPRGMLQTRAPRAEEVVTRVQVSTQQIQAMASAAARAGKNVFTVPPQPVPIDGPVRVFYNRARGPLPSNAQVVMKLGFNRWDIIQEIDMAPATFLPQTMDQQWWEVTLEVPAETFRADYVLYDRRSQLYDNNAFKDFMLELANAPTEEQLMELRLEQYRAFELQRIKYLESENARLWRAVEVAALEAAGAARIDFRWRRDAALKAEADALVQQRRKVELSGVTLANSEPGMFAWTVTPYAGKRAFLAYNKARGPLAHTNNVRLHVGYDGWWKQVKQVYDMSTMSQEEVARLGLAKAAQGQPQQWWGCWVDVPHSGMVMDFVLSDNNQVVWDNNNYKDYHTRIQGAHTAEQLSELLSQALRKEREQADQEAEDRYARHAYQGTISRGEVLRKRRAALNQFLYTVPYTPVAGQKCEVYYNPEHSPLRGRPNIYLRAGFNRWTLKQPGPSTFRMEPTVASGIGFYTTTIDVPEDAWGLDMLFIDTPVDGQVTGFYDDNQGLDYHLPCRTPADGSKPIGAVKLPVRVPLKVVHVAVEMAPIAKVGGMGDVVTALGRAVQEEGHQVEVVIPKYDCLDYAQVADLRQETAFPFGGTQVRVWKGMVEGLPTTFLEPENGHFWRGVIYGRNDDHVRFGFHCGAALTYLQHYGVRPQIIHCHDWQSAAIAWGNRGSARCVFTIHNLSYGADMVARAMASCELATTVSPTYAREISGQGSIAPHLHKLYGILNGIDTDVWDPADDPHIPMPYCADTAAAGKAAARRELRTRLKLSHIDVPIVSVVTRLVAQKGIHLIKHAAWRTLERGGQFVLLGSAPDPRVQAEFNALRDQLKAQYHDRAALEFAYNEPLSHLIYAGSDMFLVPSMFEPCGLTQMIAMKYGTIPVVRKTGGLADTVFDVDHDEERAAAAGMEPNGFSFESTDNAGMDYALNRALSMWYNDQPGWQRLVSNTMRQEWSWFKPALDYLDLYYKALRS